MPKSDFKLIQIVCFLTILCARVCNVEYSTALRHVQLVPDSSEGSITNVAGILVGQSSKLERPTGCTVILCNTTCVGGVDVRGSAPGTRETDLLDPINLVDVVNAIVLSGGSAFGLDAASGVVQCLSEKKIGISTDARPVPIVPAAVLFDLNIGNDSFVVPDASLGYSACMLADNIRVHEGNVGAGSGASIGKLFGMEYAMKAGIGTTSLTLRDSVINATITVGALVAVNAVGDVYKNGTLLAGARTSDGKQLRNTMKTLFSINSGGSMIFPIGAATTLACVATDAKLTKAQAKKVAQMAHNGFARAINPIHTMFDGDIVFTLSTGMYPISDVSLIGLMAADTVERAIVRAVEQATGLPGLPSINDLKSTGQNLLFNTTLLALIFFFEVVFEMLK
jgi:L-aminopeptidase/D-esterase-like protein